MLRSAISEEGRLELDRLNFDVETSINNILVIPSATDLKALGFIKIHDLPINTKNLNIKAVAGYYKKEGNRQAYIEIYLKNLYAHVKSAESFHLMLPIQEFGLAQAIFHELGHHVRIVRSHGISKHKSEMFADKYAKRLMTKYILNSADKISLCFETLDSLAIKLKSCAEM